MSSIAEKIKMFNTKRQSKKDNPAPEIKVKTGALQDKFNIFNTSGRKNKTQTTKNENKVKKKIIKGNEIISNENSDIIYIDIPIKNLGIKNIAVEQYYYLSVIFQLII